MVMKIAALIHERELSAIEECTQVLLFDKKDSTWNVIKEMPFELENGSPSEVRDSVRSLILELGNCSVVVAKSIAGIPYHVFDCMGFSIFEADSLSDELLDELIEDVEMEKKHNNEKSEAIEPVAVDNENRWFMDLIALQENHPKISSKQALRPFLQKKNFFELKIVCSHVPPWLDVELPAMRLGYLIESKKEGRIEAIISNALCKG